MDSVLYYVRDASMKFLYYQVVQVINTVKTLRHGKEIN